MRFSDFYQHFSKQERPPVRVQELVDVIKLRHPRVGSVTVFPVDFGKPTGQAHYRMIDMDRTSAYEDEFGDVEISYCVSLDDDPLQRRYALAKELMHVFDSREQLVDSREKFVAFLREIQNKPISGPSPAIQSEYDTRWMAVVVLCPKDLRDARLEAYRSGQLEDFDLAEEFRIPEWVVPFVMDDYYEEAFALLMNGKPT